MLKTPDLNARAGLRHIEEAGGASRAPQVSSVAPEVGRSSYWTSDERLARSVTLTFDAPFPFASLLLWLLLLCPPPVASLPL